MKIVEMPVATLVAAKAPYNPRVIAPEELEALKRSLAEFGLVEPVIFNERTGRVVGGHQRVDAMEALGWTTAPVNVVDLDEPREQALNLALNKISGQWDESKLRGLLDGLGNELAALAGFNAREQKAMAALGSLAMLEQEAVKERVRAVVRADLADPRHATVDAPAPTSALARVQTGDLWQLGQHRLLCGDATQPETFNRLMDGVEKARLLCTDPPYGVALAATKAGMTKHTEELANDELDGPALQAFLEATFRAVLPRLDHAAWYIWHAHLTQAFFAAAAVAAADVLLHRQIIWVKPSMLLTRSGQYHWRHEPCFYGWVRGQPPAWHESKDLTSVWELARDPSEGFHPTQKPVELFCIPMRVHTLPGETCLEPFAGSGSQIMAGELLGRRVMACEIKPAFCDGILARWEALTGQRAQQLSAGTSNHPSTSEKERELG